MERTTLSSKGQMVVPKSIRRQLNLRTGARLLIEPAEEGFLVRLAPKLSHEEQVDRLAGSLARPGQKRMTEAQLNRAIGKMLMADDERTKTKPMRRA